MKKGAVYAVVLLTAVTPLGACANQRGNQSGTSSSTSAPPGTERMTTQLKTTDGTSVGTATFDFANGYATVTVETTPNQVLNQGFHGLQIHSVGKCEGDFSSVGTVFQASGHTGHPASGDLTALQVRSDGSGKLVTTSNSFSAADLRSNSGSALIVHQDVDNLGSAPAAQPSKMVACGVIAAASATTTSSTTTTTVTTSTTTTEVPPASTSTSTSTSTVTVTSAPTGTTSPSKTATTNSLPPGG